MHECAVEHGSFSKIDDLLAYKTNINKLREIETTPCILSDHNGKKFEINTKGTPENAQSHGN